MQRSVWLSMVVGVAVTGLTACAPDTPAGVTADPSFDAASGSGGAVLVRGTRITFLVHLDAARGLLSVHAPADLCGDGSFNRADAQFVTTPSEIEQFIAQLRAPEEQVAVYAASSFEEAGMVGTAETAGFAGLVDVGAFCGFLEGPALVAAGSVRRVSMLSNASFAANWTGTLTGSDGNPAQLTEIYQLGADALDPANQASWVVHTSSVLLR